MGLPGSGKTTLAARLTAALFPDVQWYNADAVREKYNDWDFSTEGRLRQAARLRELASLHSDVKYVIVDFVAALPEQRELFGADFIIWMDTIKKSRYADTNSAFVPPENYTLRLTDFNYSVDKIAYQLTNV